MNPKCASIVVLTLAALARAEDSNVTTWLDKLEARGKDIRSLSGNVVYEKFNPLLADGQTRIGKVTFLAGNQAKGQAAKFLIDFSSLLVGDAVREQHVSFTFDGAWLVERDFEKRQFIKRQIVRPGQVLDPLQIDGPFPVPIGQKRDEVLARFTVTLAAPAADDPKPFAGSDPVLHMHLVPRADAASVSAKRFKSVDVWFDRTQLIPVKVISVDDTDETTTVTLSDVKINGDSEADLAKMFDTTPPVSDWHVEMKPFEP